MVQRWYELVVRNRTRQLVVEKLVEAVLWSCLALVSLKPWV